MLVVENILQSEIKRVVHDAIETIVGVRRYIANVTIEYFANLIDSSSCSIFFPEIFSDLRDSVDSDSIEVKLFNNPVDPLEQSFANERIILIKIRKASEATHFHLMLIVPVVNDAIGMVMGGLIEWGYFIKVHTDVCRMVSNYIKHHPDTLGLGSLN